MLSLRLHFTHLSSLYKLSHWPIMQKVHCYFTFVKLQLLVSSQFQFLNVKTKIIFPLRYLYTIGYWKYLGLEDGPPIFKQDFTCLDLLIFKMAMFYSVIQDFYLLWQVITKLFWCSNICIWPIPRSIANTNGISFDFFLYQLLRCFSSLAFIIFMIENTGFLL